jgi:hypothetical protein
MSLLLTLSPATHCTRYKISTSNWDWQFFYHLQFLSDTQI